MVLKQKSSKMETDKSTLFLQVIIKQSMQMLSVYLRANQLSSLFWVTDHLLQLLPLPEMLSRVSDDLPSHAFSSLFPGRNKQVETLAKESFPDLE